MTVPSWLLKYTACFIPLWQFTTGYILIHEHWACPRIQAALAVTTIQQNLRHLGQFNLLRIEHTFLTPTAHRWASKAIKILISHVTNFSSWLNVSHYDGIYCYLVSLL
jgi:hypothetical protein